MSSVPGYCEMSRFGSTNGIALGWLPYSQAFEKERYRYFRSLVYARLLMVIEGDVSDEIKVFVKPEPHKRNKIEEGRFRLISSVSLVDAMIDRILFMGLMLKVKNKFFSSGVMIGWAPVQGGYRYPSQLFNRRNGKKILLADRSSWDWTYQWFMAEASRDLIFRLTDSPPDWWVAAVNHRFESLFKTARFRFDDGEVIQQDDFGIMKSGCYLTIFLNSVAQLLLHAEIAEFDGPFICIGDDTAQLDQPDEYLDKLKDFGIMLKVKRTEEIEFAGFYLTLKAYIPAYVDKHLFTLAHLQVDDEDKVVQTLRSYQIMYAFVPEMLEIIRRIAVDLGLRRALMSTFWLREQSQG